MRIEERKSKKAKKGVTYRVKVDYVDEYGIKCTYSKSGFSSKAKGRRAWHGDGIQIEEWANKKRKHQDAWRVLS